jgi:type III pantothenate kinase
MNLVIDAGNTLTKAALFDGKEIVEEWSGENVQWQTFAHWYKNYDINHAIVSDVKGVLTTLHPLLQQKGNLVIMSSSTPTPLTLQYETPDTLGTDRLAAAVYGSSLFPGFPTLTIQMGTCLTFEMTSAHGEYLGGAISPGLDMRFNALHTFTARLPLVKKEKINFLIGKNSAESILSGVINGCAAETDGLIDQYRELFPGLKVILGGGDRFFFDKRLKNRIFATANLVLTGLNIILEHNK